MIFRRVTPSDAAAGGAHGLRVPVSALLAACMVGCGVAKRPPEKPLVFVSIAPQAYFVERIAGDAVNVAVLMPPAADHLNYDPRPSQMRELSRAGLYIRIGLPFETLKWGKIRSVNPEMRLVDGLEGTEGAGAKGDRHVWLSPRKVMPHAKAICAALVELLPGRAEDFELNLHALLEDLHLLDAELSALFEPVRGKGFWVYHPSWDYFADAYGIRQFAMEREGKKPGTRSFARRVAEAKASAIKVIFVEPSMSQGKVSSLAAELGAELRVLDPYARDYVDNLQAAGKAIAEAMS